MLEVKVEDFGPIRKGHVKLRPLTIFVGPNNSGKSYFAMLFYALHGAPHALYGPHHRFHRADNAYMFPYETALHRRRLTDSDESLHKWISELPSKGGNVSYPELPPVAQKAVQDALKSYFEVLQRGLVEELSRCFGALLPELNRKGSGNTRFTLNLSQSKPKWSFAAHQAGEDLKAEEPDVDLGSRTFKIGRRFLSSNPANLAHLPPYIISEELLSDILASIVRSLSNAYYFPAARSGILHSHKALASFLVRQSPLVGLERIEVPQLSGVITDFVGELLTIEKRKEGKDTSRICEIANDLEGSVLRGEVSLETSKRQYPEIYYRVASNQFPLHRTSSMVSELAPIVLFLKHKVKAQDLLIIEEPESHLHPASQLRLAKALAELVKADVKILLTTTATISLLKLATSYERPTWLKKPRLICPFFQPQMSAHIFLS